MKLLMMILLLLTFNVNAASPVCDQLGENYVGWPTVDPVWEMCYLNVADSSAMQGSSLEVRKIHLNGFLVMERVHMPMLFASYTTSTCYRDWKDTNASFLKADKVENPTRSAITTCDASTVDDQVVFDCPFNDPNGSGQVGDPSDCITGVQIEKYDNRMVITTNHSASWYKYTARYIFHADGRIQPRFGFGNSTGNSNSITHWHTGYWRMNFDIDGADDDEIYVVDGENEILKTEEFSDLRHKNGQPLDISWMVKDSITGRGYRVAPETEGDAQLGFVDEFALTNNPSGRNFHMTDVMATRYKLINGTLTEYSDTPGENALLNCDMIESNLVGDENDQGNLPESLVDENLVFWYRTAVEDQSGQGMLCKTGGPTLYPVGDWGLDTDVAPTATADTETVEENSVDNVMDVMGNDIDPDGGDNVIESVTQPVNGTVTIDNDTQLLYSPSLDYCNDNLATDDFTYTLNGGSVGQVSVTVTCFDDDLIFETGFELLPPL